MQSLRGQGDTPGSAAAASYFWQAVTDGNLRAELALAELYLRGDGVTKDCDQARVLLHTAASHGSDDAPRVLASLSSYGCEPPVKKKPR
jgi:TPR repeat protein